jgi:hypothetical protein
MKILNFASCNIDFVYSLDHIVAPKETETSSDFNVFFGGKGLNLRKMFKQTYGETPLQYRKNRS